MARRLAREQVSQNTCLRPRSTAVLHVSVWSSGAWVPQKSQVTSSLTPRRLLRRRPPRRLRETAVSRYVVIVTSYRLTVVCSPAIRVRASPVGGGSDRASEGETRLLRGLLGLAAHPAGHGQVVAAP
jgi:hypothetical protein